MGSRCTLAVAVGRDGYTARAIAGVGMVVRGRCCCRVVGSVLGSRGGNKGRRRCGGFGIGIGIGGRVGGRKGVGIWRTLFGFLGFCWVVLDRGVVVRGWFCVRLEKFEGGDGLSK